MENKEFNILAIAAVFISVICLTVAFASLNKILTISGSSTLKQGSWSIKFENPTNLTNSLNSSFVSGQEPSVVGNTVYFQTVISGTNEYVTFDIPVKNDGAIDAILSTITTNKTGSDNEKLLIQIMDTNNNIIDNGTFDIDSGITKTIRVKILVDPALTENDLPLSSDITTEIAFTFVQK